MKRTKIINNLDNILDGSCHGINRISSRVLLAFHPPKLAHAILGVPLKSYHPAMYMFLTLLGFTFTFNINNVSAENIDTNITIKPSLTLDISSNKISMDLDPASKNIDEQDLTVSVGTNHPKGYKLYVSSGNTDTSGNTTTNLINIADNTKTIPNITSTYPLSSMPVNSWGYRLTNNSTISTGDYGVFTSGSIVSESDKPVNNNISTLGFASKIDYTMPSGTYELTLNFKALPIVTQYYMQDLGKDPELASRVCTTDPTVVIDNRDEQAYMIRRLPDGRCWMLDNLNLDLTNKDIAEGLNSQNTNASDLSLNYLRNGGGTASDQWANAGLTYTNWTTGYSYSQPLINRGGECDPAVNAVDGLWTNAYPCTNDFQNASYTPSTIASSPWKNPGATGYFMVGEGSFKIGSYYNYCAASAGSYCYGDGVNEGTLSGDATMDICPAGWRLPTAGPSGEFAGLCSSIKGSACDSAHMGIEAMNMSDPNSMQAILSTPLSGDYRSRMIDGSGKGSAFGMGQAGAFWSSTNINDRMFYLAIGKDLVALSNTFLTFDGESVRCILSES